MAFLNKLSNVAKTAADKTGDMVEVTKLNAKINGSKSKIAAIKTQLGEYYWSKYVVGETLDAEATELCAQIKAESDTIVELNREIQKIKDVPSAAQVNGAPAAPTFAACASCGGVIPNGKKFCPECGAPTASQPEGVTCPYCGHPVSAGKKFCQECGAAVQ